MGQVLERLRDVKIAQKFAYFHLGEREILVFFKDIYLLLVARESGARLWRLWRRWRLGGVTYTGTGEFLGRATTAVALVTALARRPEPPTR